MHRQSKFGGEGNKFLRGGGAVKKRSLRGQLDTKTAKQDRKDVVSRVQRKPPKNSKRRKTGGPKNRRLEEKKDATQTETNQKVPILG